MYLAHTSFGMVMREVAIGFSRDRTTVMYACHLVEDSRDDEDYDAVVSTLEKVVNQDFSAWRMAA
ncbi:putative chromosomal replication initiator DnaA domain protein [Brucella thiophenivorans]|uniref:Putative chromosomal replication initiator DnaA domain protein n=2 Tax=Brucella thiophenivorans TaxID=571255 RepID=A0A256FXP6_9HYPH|nr:putative chromosomal replication initiator DnaA domain protein [Brucella thiophenivorans]